MEEKDDDLEDFGADISEEKAKKIKGKLDRFMAEIATDLLDDEDYTMAKKKIFHILTRSGITTSLSYMKAFREGFQMAKSLQGMDNNIAMMMMTCTSKIVDEMELEMKLKVDQSMKPKK